MPGALRGNVHWYDHGPVIGAELSDNRPAAPRNQQRPDQPATRTLHNRADVHGHARRQVSHAPHPYRRSRLLGVHQTNQVCSPRTVGRSHRQGITGRNELRNPVHRPATGAPTRPRADRNDSGHVPNLRRNHLGSPSRRHPGPGPRQPDTDHRLQRRKQHGCGGGHRVRRERAPSSPVAVPMIIGDSQQAASVLLHRVRSIDTTQRHLTPAGETHPEHMQAVSYR